MLCKKPYMLGNMPCPCGHCMPCRVNRRRLWTHRILLESMLHGDNCFLTLTYDDNHLPSGGALVPPDVLFFIKRLRTAYKDLYGKRFRYFLVGEYGDESERPHYHLILFGFPTCAYGKSRYSMYQKCCPFCDLVRDKWGKGMVDLQAVEMGSIRYVAGYCIKKMTAKDDKRLNGRHPEFARMSRKPGIGAGYMEFVAKAMVTPDGEVLGLGDDVPLALKQGGRSLPLGRYLRRKLREKFYGSPKPPEEVVRSYTEELLAMFQASFDDPQKPTGTLKQFLLDKNRQKVLQLESRLKIYQPRRSI